MCYSIVIKFILLILYFGFDLNAYSACKKIDVDHNTFLGCGSFGYVRVGSLSDGTIVAVKKNYEHELEEDGVVSLINERDLLVYLQRSPLFKSSNIIDLLAFEYFYREYSLG